jgi:hypothetical protein
MTDKQKKNLVHYYPNSIYVLPNGHVTNVKKSKDTLTMATTTAWLHWIMTDKPKKNLVHYYPNSIYVLPNGHVTNVKKSKDTYGGKNTSFDDRTGNGQPSIRIGSLYTVHSFSDSFLDSETSCPANMLS